MRVLYVNQTSQVSGAERSLLSLLAGIREQVEPVVACPDGELAAAVESAGLWREPIVGTQASFRLHPLHTSRGLLEIGRSALGVRRLASRLQPDIVHANTTRAGLLALLGRRRSGPPVLVHIRDWFPDGRFPRAVHGLIARRADAIVANSAYVAAQFDDLSPRHPVRVVHNPVELDRFDPAAADGAAVRRELGLAGDVVVLSVVAQLTPWKGQDDAIRALAKLPGEPVLLLAGSAKFAGAGTQYDNVAYERELHELATQLGVAERVRFLGERSDVANVLAATDVALLPSWREAFGRIAVEAMAMGIPVAATSEGGPAEIVREGVDGLLIPPRRPDLWATELTPLLADPEQRQRMSQAARERARDFSLSAHVTAILSIYAELQAR